MRTTLLASLLVLWGSGTWAGAQDEATPAGEETTGEMSESTLSPEQTEEGWAQSVLGDGWASSSSFRFRYRLRFTDDFVRQERDQDVYGLLNLTLTKREQGKERMRITLLANVAADLDSTRTSGDHPFHDLHEFDRGWRGYIYSGYVDYNWFEDEWGPSNLRVGRQRIIPDEGITMDGLRVELSGTKSPVGGLDFSAFGGRPVYFYKSVQSDDYLVGGGLLAHVSGNFDLGADLLRIVENAPGDSDIDHADDLIVLNADLSPHENVRVRGSYSFLEGESNRFTARGSWWLDSLGLDINGAFIQQKATLRDFSTDLSPYFLVLGVYYPYYQYQLSGTKQLWEDAALEIGTDIRTVKRGENEGTFNHSFEKYFATLYLDDFLTEDMSASVSLDRWNVSDDDDLYEIGADLSYRFDEDLRLAVGSDYMQYKYDIALEQERERVRSMYVKASYQLIDDLVMQARYAHEWDSEDTYNVLDMAITVRF